MSKGRVTKVGDTWFYTVTDGSKFVFADNANDWRKVFDVCYFDVAVARRVLNAGHTFKRSWAQVVDRAVIR